MSTDSKLRYLTSISSIEKRERLEDIEEIGRKVKIYQMDSTMEMDAMLYDAEFYLHFIDCEGSSETFVFVHLPRRTSIYIKG